MIPGRLPPRTGNPRNCWGPGRTVRAGTRPFRAHRTDANQSAHVSSPDPDGARDNAPVPTPVRLTYLGKDILLMPGSYTIGRSAACHIVVDDQMVSRRHARIEIASGRYTIEDLGSINGVFVNGRRITTRAHPLQDEDRIDIGSAEMTFHASGVGYERKKSGTHGMTLDTLSGADPVVPADDALDAAPDSSGSTSQVNGILMLSAIAERALESGRIREAEEMLESHLAGVMDDALARRLADPATIEAALDAALSLAVATRKGRWFDYAIGLLLQTGHHCADALLARLENTLASVGAVNVDQLRRYALAVRGTSPGFDQLRAAQRLDTMARAAAARDR